MMKTINRLVFVLLFSIRIFLSNAHELVDYVNPMIGATTLDNIGNTDLGLGKTFPGVCTPFGLVQLSPDTKTGEIMGRDILIIIQLLRDLALLT